MTPPHKVLGIEPNATAEEIKKAFLKGSRTEHPDAGGTKERFVRLLDAYETMMEAVDAGSPGPTEHAQAADTASAPNSSDPNSSDPNSSDPNSSDPNSSDPNSSDPNSSDPNSSYEAHVREVWEAAQAYRPAAERGADEPESAIPLLRAALLTPVAAGAIACCFAFDGRYFYPALWSFLFCILLVVIVWTSLLAAVVGGSVDQKDTLLMYSRTLIGITCLTLVILAYPTACGTCTVARAPRTMQLVPRWWPMHSDCWSLYDLPFMRDS